MLTKPLHSLIQFQTRAANNPSVGRAYFARIDLVPDVTASGNASQQWLMLGDEPGVVTGAGRAAWRERWGGRDRSAWPG